MSVRKHDFVEIFMDIHNDIIRFKIKTICWMNMGECIKQEEASTSETDALFRAIEFFRDCLPDEGSKELEELAIKMKIK